MSNGTEPRVRRIVDAWLRGLEQGGHPAPTRSEIAYVTRTARRLAETPYVVEAADRYGVFARTNAATFDEAVEVAERYRAEHPRAAVVFGNEDRADVDTNGLTDEEHEALEARGF